MNYFDDFVQSFRHGATHRFPFTVTQLDNAGVKQPVDLAGHPNLYLIAKRSLEDSDANAVFLLIIGSGLAIVNAAAGSIDVEIAGSLTASLPNRPLILYAELRTKDTANRPWSLAAGRFPVLPAVRLTTP